MNSKEQICRLCLKGANGYWRINDIMKQLFDILLLKLNLDITRGPIVCQDCVEAATKCLNFKSTCLDTEQFILSFSANREKLKQSIKLTYAEKKHLVTVNDENLDLCRFCMSQLVGKQFVPLNTLLNEIIFEMVTKYMPEMDLNIPEDPMICAMCREDLESYSHLVVKSLDTETKIETYCKEHKSDNMKHLNDILHPKIIVKLPIEYQIHKIKQESNGLEDPDGIYADEAYIGIIKQEELDIKDEKYNLSKNLEHDDSFPCKMNESDMTSLRTRHCDGDGYAYQQKIQTNTMEEGSIHMGNLEEKGDETSDKQISHHVWKSGKTGERKYIECNLIATNLDIYNYVNSGDSVSEMGINRHTFAHKDATEIIMYKCSLCDYKGKRKGYLESHMLVHKDISEIKMYKCAVCIYESKSKSNLERHMLLHKNVSEIKMYKCAVCIYESKSKSNLERHMLVHKNVSEIKMYKCTLCTYESKSKCNLERHILVHKDDSEIKMYKCALCAYEAKTKIYLEKHMLVHTDFSETKMFKCALCAYEGKRKMYLSRHMLVHEDVSVMKMFKCSLCAFKTKQKSYLKKHMLIHKDVSKIVE